MRYLRKYNESKKFGLGSLSSEDLEEKLKWLIIERDEANKEISTINNILIGRKESNQSKYSESLPESIFDFDKDQLEWIFEHHHGTTKKHYEVSRKYFEQLFGVLDSGFNPDTKEYYFTILVSSHIEQLGPMVTYQFDAKINKTLEFLGDNLKKNDGYVKFDISYTEIDSGRPDHALYYSSTDIRYKQHWGSSEMRQGISKGSVQELIESLVDYNIGEIDNEDNW